MGHVARARRDSANNSANNSADNAEKDLPVAFFLKTHPGERFEGTVLEVHTSADVHADEGNTVLVRVAIDKDQLPDLRPGATVTAKIHCGRRPIGYVWFHDLIAFAQSKIAFWF